MKHKNKHTLNYLLTPDYVFNTYDEVTPEFLNSLGIKALLIDIDNTLAPYEQALPNKKTIKWFEELKAAGISASLISNNHQRRVKLFSSLLDIDAYANSAKPFAKTMVLAMKKMGSTPENTAGLGDQLFTDTLAAHRLDIISIIVPPIKDKRSIFVLSKRLLERPFMRRYAHLQKKGDEK